MNDLYFYKGDQFTKPYGEKMKSLFLVLLLSLSTAALAQNGADVERAKILKQLETSVVECARLSDGKITNETKDMKEMLSSKEVSGKKHLRSTFSFLSLSQMTNQDIDYRHLANASILEVDFIKSNNSESYTKVYASVMTFDEKKASYTNYNCVIKSL